MQTDTTYPKHSFFTKDRDRIPRLANHQGCKRVSGEFIGQKEAHIRFRTAECGTMGIRR